MSDSPKTEIEVLPPDAQAQPGQPDPEEDQPSKGPSLFLLYGILFLVMLFAMGIAALIVLPFYHRR